MLIDSLCKRFFKKKFDNKGQLAKNGEVNLNLIKIGKKNLLKKNPISFDNYYFKLNDFISSRSAFMII